MMSSKSASMVDRSTYEFAHRGLQQIVDDLASPPEIALARIWLLQDQNSCDVCRNSAVTDDADCSLHLAASAGQSRNRRQPEVWNKRDGMSHRFPLRSQKIGRIGATGKPLIVRNAVGESALTNPEWLHREGIQSFFGYPLVDSGKIFGVLAVFSRRELADFNVHLLRQVADGAARLLSDANRLTEISGRSSRLAAENQVLRTNLRYQNLVRTIVAKSPASKKWEGQIRLAAQHDQPVLIRGEHGSGKEFSARLIHDLSRNSSGPFLRINAASLTESLVDALLLAGGFEHRPREKALHPSEAHCRGTLLLDGIEATPMCVQSRLTEILLKSGTHALSERSQKRHRLLFASAADLKAEVADGRLQNELYCALSITEIGVPALHERLDDFGDLVREVVAEICRREQRPVFEVDSSNIEDLLHRDWPGNVRELRQVIESAIWHASDENLSTDGRLQIAAHFAEAADKTSFVRENDLKRQERANLIACLKKCHWKVYGQGGAAEALGVKPTTLIYRMKILGIRKPER